MVMHRRVRCARRPTGFAVEFELGRIVRDMDGITGKLMKGADWLVDSRWMVLHVLRVVLRQGRFEVVEISRFRKASRRSKTDLDTSVCWAEDGKCYIDFSLRWEDESAMFHTDDQ